MIDDLFTEIYRDKDRSLRALHIRLTGDWARLPSISNGKHFSRFGGMFRNKEHVQKFADMQTIFQSRSSGRMFGTEKTFVIIANGKRKAHRWDSHNVIKGALDWLQQCGVFDDDSSAEVFCYKKEHYPAQYEHQKTMDDTDIWIIRRSLLQSLLGETLTEIKEVGRGNIHLIG